MDFFLFITSVYIWVKLMTIGFRSSKYLKNFDGLKSLAGSRNLGSSKFYKNSWYKETLLSKMIFLLYDIDFSHFQKTNLVKYLYSIISIGL